ncbi:MAG: S26 family signal peptidase [Gammaproteobacteria bacterium]|nr:S26 family signal peptidase [Gammaproteobacteria bacterium]
MTARRVPGRRRAERERGYAALVLLLGLLALWLTILSLVHFNASWSGDAWGYLRLPLFGEPEFGAAVMFAPPDDVNSPVPYLKTVRGLPGAAVVVDADGTVRIDGTAVGRAKPNALDGRRLTSVESGTIPAGHYYLHSDHPDSHDSRYAEIGLVPRERILGRAVALPDIPWLGLDGPLAGPEAVHGGGAQRAESPDAVLPHARLPTAVPGAGR